MNLDEWHEQAGRDAYEAMAGGLSTPMHRWDDISEDARERWREVARAVLPEGKIEVRPSAELAEAETREENERLKKIARDWAQACAAWRRNAEVGLADNQRLREQVQNYEKSADGHVAKFDRQHERLRAAESQLDAVRKIILDDAALSHEHRMHRLISALVLPAVEQQVEMMEGQVAAAEKKPSATRAALNVDGWYLGADEDGAVDLYHEFSVFPLLNDVRDLGAILAFVAEFNRKCGR